MISSAHNPWPCALRHFSTESSVHIFKFLQQQAALLQTQQASKPKCDLPQPAPVYSSKIPPSMRNRQKAEDNTLFSSPSIKKTTRAPQFDTTSTTPQQHSFRRKLNLPSSEQTQRPNVTFNGTLHATHFSGTNHRSNIGENDARSKANLRVHRLVHFGLDEKASSVFAHTSSDKTCDTAESYALMESLTQEDVECTPLLEEPFVDFVEIHVSSGSGGWSKRGAYRNKKGNGVGYGGHGSHVILECSHRIESLVKVRPRVIGENGGNAWGTHRGAHASPTIVRVPVGTIVRQRTRIPASAQSKTSKPYQYMFWHQFLIPGEQLLVAQGGRGGIARSLDRKHKVVKPEQGEQKRLQLELRLVNDVALVGFPNAGKSSILASITRYLKHLLGCHAHKLQLAQTAYSRIGPEPYSTSRPHIGSINYRDGITITLCDLPAFFRGAHKDKVKGRRILRHLYRSKVVLYVLDTASEADGERDLLKEFLALRSEVHRYSPANALKRELIVGTKCDMLHRQTLLNLDSLYFRLRATCPDIPIVGVSARFGLGLERLVTAIRQCLYPDLLERTSRIHVQPIEETLRPSQEDQQQILQRLDVEALPPVLHPNATSSKTKPPDPPVTQIHPSYSV